MKNYILSEDGKTPIICDNPVLWARWFESTDRHVARWISPDGKVSVSTVFLGLDHNFSIANSITDGPILWETLIQGGEHDQFMERYTSFEKAINGHEQAIIMIEESLKKVSK